MGGFWWFSNYSSVKFVYNLLNCKINWFLSGGNCSSIAELVRLTPRHVRIPRGYRATKKSVSSLSSDLGEWFRLFSLVGLEGSGEPAVLQSSSSRNTYFSWGVNKVNISTTISVSSCYARQARGWNKTGNLSSLFHSVKTTHSCFM